MILTESLLRLLSANGDELFRFVVVKASITAHLDVYEDIGFHQLGHEDGVLADHQRTGSGKNRILVEIDVVGNQFVQDFCI